MLGKQEGGRVFRAPGPVMEQLAFIGLQPICFGVVRVV